MAARRFGSKSAKSKIKARRRRLQSAKYTFVRWLRGGGGGGLNFSKFRYQSEARRYIKFLGAGLGGGVVFYFGRYARVTQMYKRMFLLYGAADKMKFFQSYIYFLPLQKNFVTQ